MNSKISLYVRLMRLDKPIGIFLLLWPTLMALWIAGKGHPDPYIVTIFILGVIVMRSAGCVINDFADREFDRAVTRTQNRPLATQQLSVKEALGCFLLLLFLAFCLVLPLNRQTLLLSFVGVFLATLYPFLKRFTHLPQLGLGAAFSWGIILVFSAITQTIPQEAWILFLANIGWTLVYDTEYAMADRKEDLHIGIKSTAILLGKSDVFVIGFFQVLTLLCFGWLGRVLALGKLYYVGILIAAILMGYHQYLMKDRVPENCFKVFLHNNYVGAVIFLGLLLGSFSSSF